MASLTALDTIWILVSAFLVKNGTEIKGLDIEEHGMEAYSGFQIFLNE